MTTQASTGRCPYDLVKQGPAPSLFPQLVTSVKQQQQAEKTAVSHGVARQRKNRQFLEGEEVIIYDAHTKVSQKGKIVEVLGRNTYLADVNGLAKHVSGDVVSKVRPSVIADAEEPRASGGVIKRMGSPGTADTERPATSQEGLLGQDEEDTASLCSDSSVDSSDSVDEDIPVILGNAAPPPVANVPRRRRREADFLAQPLQGPRLRPLVGRVHRQVDP